ncbi:hypothetical protein KUTeg_005804 [Tegillarca granosa]|uniref:Elongator complex protein 2 n=1 Tax=Tegillarca granosa TaxID=220873 RepID=A0ABQ9FH33_TEGGR|nr:hypothetical protein KUTeg_005804 [Tegillarca granosa]
MEQCYVSTGCNRTPHSAVWGSNGLICYAADNSIAIYQPEHEDIEAQVLSTLNHHKNRVNCVTWIKSYGKEFPPGFVSGSVDCNVVVWQSDGNGKYKPSSTLKSHTGSVNAVTAIQTSFDNSQSDQIYVASSSADSTVNIWKKTGDDEFVLIQTLKFGTGFILDLVATVIPNTNVTLLACGCDDHKIHLYVEQDNQFVKVMSLSGHEDWIRAVDFTTDDDGDILLASAAQDNFIRIWRLSRKTEGVDLIKPIKELSLEEEIKIKGNTFKFNYNKEVVVFAVSLESVLHGHENWIYSIKWQPKLKTDTGYHQPMCLLSASMDKTMILWKPDPESGVWVEDVRVGEVGGNTLGLYGGMFSPDGTSIMAHGYQGAFHQWTFCQKTNSWRPVVTVGGHFDEVQDLDWDKGSGQFVISVSTDQTSRLHAPWVKDKRKEAQNRPEGASVPALGLSNKAVSSGQAVTKTSDIEQHPNDQYPEVYFTAVTLKEPPTEEHLLQNTLWPETQKLYGHGYEIFSLATDPTGQILASSCKAAKTDFAGVILWDISSWRQIETLQGHTLTVTQMSFSHNGCYLLTVSRDRTWCLYKKNTTESSSNSGLSDKSFRRIAHTEKQGSVHSRIIWSCCWSHDDKFFFTASRDKKVMVWQKDEFEKEQAGTPSKPVSILEVSDSVTAIDVAPLFVKDNRYLVSVGLENGSILLYTYLHGDKKDNSCWQQVSESSKQYPYSVIFAVI